MWDVSMCYDRFDCPNYYKNPSRYEDLREAFAEWEVNPVTGAQTDNNLVSNATLSRK
jgi:hypothetical protein